MPSTEHKNIAARLRRYYLSLKREIAESERLMAEDGEDYSKGRRKLEAMTRPDAVFKAPPSPSIGAFRLMGRAIVAVMEESAEGLDLLYHSFYYGAADFYCDAAFYMTGKPNMLIKHDFNRVSLLLATGVTLGCWTEAERIANAVRFALTERRRDRGQLVCGFPEVDCTSVAPFVLHLYARWSGKPFALDDLPLRSMQAYEPLLSLWQTEDMQAFAKAVLETCDFHMERSKLSEVETYEFTIPEHVLFPVEILALLRLRETKGLVNPVIDHPLMQTPIGRLPEIKSVPHDEMMDRAVANYLSTLPSSVTEQLFL